MYKTLRYKIDKNLLTESDVKDFPLDYAPKTQKMFCSMMSRHDHCWTLAEYWVVSKRELPPDYLMLDLKSGHNIIIEESGIWCFKKEVERKLTLELLFKKIQKGQIITF
jgi:hypothetical protein